MSRKKSYPKIAQIHLVPHDPRWIASFEAERDKIKSVLSTNVIAIHHVGSTAIPHIYAKPIVDILVVVANILHVNKYNFAMLRLGYEARGEYNISGRRYFTKTTKDGQRTHNIHIFQSDHPDSTWLPEFRDHLLKNECDATAYNKIKHEMALKFPADIDMYLSGKRQFIESIRMKIRRYG